MSFFPVADGVPSMIPLSVANVLPVLLKAFQDITNTTVQIQNALNVELDLTGTQRRRLFSARARKWGFITKSWETITTWPDFAPSNFSIPDMTKLMANPEQTRQLLTLVNQLSRFLDDYLLTCHDTLYRDGLRIYRNLQEQARARVPGAEDLYQILRQFFHLRRRPRATNAEPTMREMKRDINRVLHGTADGEIIIKNESPHMVGGVHEVIDDVRPRGKRGAEIRVKESEE